MTATALIALEEAHAGASVPITMPNGKVLSVKIPAKVEEGQQIRLKGQGQASPMGGEPGDALIAVKFRPHKLFRREGNDLHVDVPVTLYEAVLGGKIRVPTLTGKVELSLQANVDTTKSLRLKGKGLYGKGDLYVRPRVILPEGGDADLQSLMRFWSEQKPYKVRD
jgi:DnaJ-class molecular chaperone